MTIERTTDGSGLRVVTEAMPALRSVAVGVWVGTGSRDEQGPLLGASHFLEHLLFKGTDARSARAIAEAVESVGGDMNAFTTQEITAFYVRVPDAQLDLAIDILSDIVWSPALRPDEVESERQVILEEIRMRDDAPDDVVHEVFAAALFPDHPLGREVIGTEQTITDMGRDTIAGYHGSHYHPSNTVWSAAGNLDHAHVLDRVLGAMPGSNGARPAREPGAASPPRRLSVVRRPTEQAHVVLGFPGIRRDDPDRFALTVLNQVLGGGMSSRLFQEVREERGLAYSVYSYRAAYQDTGAYAVYAGTSPDRVDETLDVIEAELDRVVADGGVSSGELDAAKGHLTGSTALSLESSSSRMHRIGSSELTLGEVPDLDEVVARIEKVTAEDVERVVARLFTAPRTLAVVGPFDEADFESRVA